MDNTSSTTSSSANEVDDIPQMSKRAVCEFAYRKGTDCKLAVGSDSNKFYNYCRSNDALIDNLRQCIKISECDSFQSCSRFKNASDVPIEAPAKVAKVPPVEVPDKPAPNPKFVMCENLKAKLEKCFNPTELKDGGHELDKIVSQCVFGSSVYEELKSSHNYEAALDCFIQNDKSECTDFKLCYQKKLVELKKAEEDRLKAEKIAAEAELKAERLAFEAKKKAYQKTPNFKLKSKFCSNTVKYFQTCQKYAYLKAIQEQKINNAELINRCLYRNMDEEDDVDAWKNWNFCYDKTGGNCTEMNTCLRQIDQ